MKAVTIHLEESVYSEFQTLARKTKRSASELIREAMEMYRQKSKNHAHSLADSPPPANFWWHASEVVHCHITDKAWQHAMSWIEKHSLGRKRILDTTLAATYHVCGIQSLATANPADFAVFGVFQFESWAKSPPFGTLDPKFGS